MSINTKELIDTKLVELTLTPCNNQGIEAFKMSHYAKNNMNVSADILDTNRSRTAVNLPSLLDPVTYCYGNIAIIGLDAYHAICLSETVTAHEKGSQLVCI